MNEQEQNWEETMPEQFQVALKGIRDAEVPKQSLEKFLFAAEGLEMTAASWRRGFLNALLALVGVSVVLLGLYFAVAYFFDLAGFPALIAALGVLLCVTFSAFFLSCCYGRLIAGELLLDCGPHPARGMFLVTAVIFGIVSALSFVTQTEILGLGFACFFAVFGLYWLVISTGRLQIRTNGIWQYWGLLRWHKIRHFHWEGVADSTLCLQTHSLLPMLGKGALPVSKMQHSEIDNLLRTYVNANRST